MQNLFRATIAFIGFLFFFPNVETRIDSLFENGVYTYSDFAGDTVLALGVLAVIFLVGAIWGAVKK